MALQLKYTGMNTLHHHKLCNNRCAFGIVLSLVLGWAMASFAAVDPRWSFESNGAFRCDLDGRDAFADEDDSDLLSPSILYARVITEGLFGIEPLSFQSFQLTPRLPESWPMMQLNAIQLLGRQLDLQVSRKGSDIQVRALEQGKEIMSQTGKQGSVFEIKL